MCLEFVGKSSGGTKTAYNAFYHISTSPGIAAWKDFLLDDKGPLGYNAIRLSVEIALQKFRGLQVVNKKGLRMIFTSSQGMKTRECFFFEGDRSICVRICFCVVLMHFMSLGCTVIFEPENPICGNGVTEGDEVCDGEDLGGETCESLGLIGGTLLCRDDCTGYDVSRCDNEPECGNNVAEEREACDGHDLRGETCESLGLMGGVLLCREDCTGYDVSGCISDPVCGNKIAEKGEVCDGPDLRGETCEILQFVGGTLRCDSDCSLDTSLCWYWQGISNGRNQTCGVKSDETAWCWGRNYFGQLGDGTNTDRMIPVQVHDLSNVLNLSVGNDHACALKSNGTVWCWGRNFHGQLGDETNEDKTIPVRVNGLADIAEIAVDGYRHTCAAKNDGTAWCWGWNYYGQLGDGTTENRNTPVQVNGLADIARISAGGYRHSCALKDDGTAWCWGGNQYGQLGDRTTIDRNTPVRVDGLTDAVRISSKSYHTCVLKSDGKVWCWGRNYFGQLGDGTTIDRNTPVRVDGLTGVILVSAGYNHTCALKTDGTAWCWGLNSLGQLGDGTNDDENTPVQVDGLTGAVDISGGFRHTCALKSDGTAWCWGSNFNGQLGDWTTEDRNIPVEVVSQ